MLDELKQQGYYLGQAKLTIEEAIKCLEEIESSVQRVDTVTSRSDVEGEDIKYAVMDTFWFHTDGCFMQFPPHYVIIEVIKAEEGGALYLLDFYNIDLPVPEKRFMFGQNDQYVKAPVKISLDDINIFRYRQDYMKPAEKEDAEDLAATHKAVEDARKAEIKLGELKNGEYVVIDNWRMLHARGNFGGERTIKRYWLD